MIKPLGETLATLLEPELYELAKLSEQEQAVRRRIARLLAVFAPEATLDISSRLLVYPGEATGTREGGSDPQDPERGNSESS